MTRSKTVEGYPRDKAPADALHPCTPGHPERIQDWSADSRVRAFLASDRVRADKAVRAPV